MPANDPEYQKQYKKKHYQANKQKYIDQAAARRKALYDEVWEIKKVPCADCGIQYEPWVMQFDHLDPKTKVDHIGGLIIRYNRKVLFEEIAKCEIVCANCHADRTYKRGRSQVD